MNPLFAESIGVNTDNLLVSQPDSAENLLSIVDTLTKSGSIDVIVVDSVRIYPSFLSSEQIIYAIVFLINACPFLLHLQL